MSSKTTSPVTYAALYLTCKHINESYSGNLSHLYFASSSVESPVYGGKHDERWAFSSLFFTSNIKPHYVPFSNVQRYIYIHKNAVLVPWTITRTQHRILHTHKKLFEIKLKQYWLPVCVVFMLSMWFYIQYLWIFSSHEYREEIGYRLNGTSFDDYNTEWWWWWCYVITIKIIRPWN